MDSGIRDVGNAFHAMACSDRFRDVRVDNFIWHPTEQVNSRKRRAIDMEALDYLFADDEEPPPPVL